MATGAVSSTRVSPPGTPPFAIEGRDRANSTESNQSEVGASSFLLLQEQEQASKQREMEETLAKMKDFMAISEIRHAHTSTMLSAHETISAIQSRRIDSLTAELKSAKEALASLEDSEAASRALVSAFANLGRENQILKERIDGLEEDSARKDDKIKQVKKSSDANAAGITKMKLVMLATGTVATAGSGAALGGAIMAVRGSAIAGHSVLSALGAGVTGYGMTGVNELENLDRV